MTSTMRLIQVPNQSYTMDIDGTLFTFRIRTFRGIAFMSLYRNDELVIGGIKCIANNPIFPDGIAKMLKGNLMFRCLSDGFPQYSDFDTPECTLQYVSI